MKIMIIIKLITIRITIKVYNIVIRMMNYFFLGCQLKDTFREKFTNSLFIFIRLINSEK